MVFLPLVVALGVPITGKATSGNVGINITITDSFNFPSFNSPFNGATLDPGTVTFDYNVSNLTGLDYCTLYVNNIPNFNMSTVVLLNNYAKTKYTRF